MLPMRGLSRRGEHSLNEHVVFKSVFCNTCCKLNWIYIVVTDQGYAQTLTLLTYFFIQVYENNINQLITLT